MEPRWLAFFRAHDVEEYRVIESKKSEIDMRLRLFLFAALAGLAALVASCGSDHAQVRFVHGSPDTVALDIVVDGKTLTTNLAFGAVFPPSVYQTVAAGSRRVEERDTGTTDNEISSTISFGSGKNYTLIASGLNASIAAVLLTDDSSAPVNGEVKVRVAHLAPDFAERVDFYVVPAGTDITGMSPTVPGLAYTQASSYQTVDGGSIEVIALKTTDQSLLADTIFDLAAGQNRTFLLLDDGGGPPNASFLQLADLN